MFLKKIFNRKFKFKYTPDAVTNLIATHLYTFTKKTKLSPLRLFVYPSGLCNDKCRYCSDGLNAENSKEKSFIRYDPERDFFKHRNYIDKLIKDIKRLKIRDLHLFGGGEPFFYKENMFYFLERLKDVDVFIRIITNANNLNEQDIERIIRDKLLSQINISFNTDSSETAKKIYVDVSRHSHTLDILNAITKYKKIYTTDIPCVDIMFTLLKVNCDKISEIIELLRGHSITYFFFQPLRCYSERQEELIALDIQQPEIARAEKKLADLQIRSNISEFRPAVGLANVRTDFQETSNPPSLINKNNIYIQCYMPLTTLSICYNGNIPLCQFRYDKQYRLNYFDTKSLNEFVKGKEYGSFVHAFINEQLPEICANCQFCVNAELDIIRKCFVHFKNR